MHTSPPCSNRAKQRKKDDEAKEMGQPEKRLVDKKKKVRARDRDPRQRTHACFSPRRCFGQVRAIGVSNFAREDLEALLKVACVWLPQLLGCLAPENDGTLKDVEYTAESFLEQMRQNWGLYLKSYVLTRKKESGEDED